MIKIIFVFLILISFKTEAQPSVLKLGDSLFLYGNYSKAIEAYKNYNNPSEIYSKIAKCYMAIGNFDEAIFSYRESVKANPNDLLLKYDLAKLLSRIQDYDEASEIFGSLIQIDSLNPNYHYELGLVQESLKDTLATKTFLRVFQLDQTHQKAIFRIAKFYLIKRQYEKVESYVNIGLKTYKDNKELISLKAQNYYWQEDYKNASKCFERLIELGESYQFIHEKLSFCYDRIYEHNKAIEQALLALKYDPKNITNIYILGMLYEGVDDYENAEKYLRQSLLLQDVPLDAEYTKLATVLNRQEKYDEAIKALKKAIRENPENLMPQFFLLTTKDKYYADIDSKIKAFEDFRKVHPESVFSKYIDMRLDELKKEKFMKSDLKKD